MFRIQRGFLLALLLWEATAIHLWADPADPYYQEATRFYQQKNYSQALDVYQAAAGVDPDPAPAYQGIGNCDYAMGNKEQALEAYEKSLQLNPQNSGLASFVQKLRAEVEKRHANDPFVKGRAAFNQKNYKLAIPYFQQVLKSDPKDLPTYYYLGYSQYLLGKRVDSAVDFGYFGRNQPDATVLAFSKKIEGSLSPEDQAWVEGQLKNGPPFDSEFFYSGVGVLVEPSLEFVSLKDVTNYKKYLTASGAVSAQSDPSYQLTASSPGIGFGVGINPYIQVADNLETGLTFEYLFINNFNSQYQDNSGSGTGVIDFQVFQVGLNARLHFIQMKEQKTSFFLDVNPALYYVGLDVANSQFSGWPFVGASGTFSSLAPGCRVKLGFDWKAAPNSILTVFAGYQFAAVSGYTGSASYGAGSANGNGKLEAVDGPTGTAFVFVPDGSSAPAGARPLTVDLSGMILGADLVLLL